MQSILTAVLIMVLSGVLWRLRGIIGWPGTLLFSLVQVATLYPVGGHSAWLYALFIMAGEPTGWKPKTVWDDGDWKRSALLGARIGLIGAVSVPLSTWLHLKFGEPPFPNNPKPFYFRFWSGPKYLLDWRGSWNEVYHGLIFSAVLQAMLVLAGGQ